MWEDCSHRISALNLLLHMAKELEENLVAAKKSIYAEEFERAMDELYKLLETVAESLNHYPQNPPEHPNMNNLDLKMMNFRHEELRIMVDDIESVKGWLKKLFKKELRDRVDELNKIVLKIEDYLIKLKGLCFDVSYITLLGSGRSRNF